MASYIKSFLAGFRLVDGTDLNNLVQPLNNLQGNGTAGTLAANGTTLQGSYKFLPQIVSAAGATQGGATAITSSKAIITVATTVSTRGVRLPTASTGLEVTVANAATFGAKVYPATGGKIGAASTNAADTTLAINKANRYIAVNTTLWVVERGA